MAKGLNKKKSWKYGVDGNYWIIGEIRTNRLYNSTEVKMVPYVSKQAFKADPLDFIEELIVEIQGIEGFNLNMPQLYQAVKDLPESPFADATDDNEV